MENNNYALKYYKMFVTPGTKAWWLLLHHVPSFNVAQLNINTDHFAQRHQKYPLNIGNKEMFYKKYIP